MQPSAEKCWSRSWTDQQCLDDIFLRHWAWWFPSWPHLLNISITGGNHCFSQFEQDCYYLKLNESWWDSNPVGWCSWTLRRPISSHFRTFVLFTITFGTAAVTLPAPWCGGHWLYQLKKKKKPYSNDYQQSIYVSCRSLTEVGDSYSYKIRFKMNKTHLNYNLI